VSGNAGIDGAQNSSEVVHRIPLQAADCDGLVLRTQYTRALAKLLYRTNS
jgi:hypothetical protein